MPLVRLNFNVTVLIVLLSTANILYHNYIPMSYEWSSWFYAPFQTHPSEERFEKTDFASAVKSPPNKLSTSVTAVCFLSVYSSPQGLFFPTTICHFLFQVPEGVLLHTDLIAFCFVCWFWRTWSHTNRIVSVCVLTFCTKKRECLYRV